MDPDFLTQTLGLVNRYVVEVKCPLDDRECNAQLVGLGREATAKYLASLAKSLEAIRGREVRIWIRVIPGFMDHERMGRIGMQVSGIATEAYLMQFLNTPENEAPFAKAKEPGPSESEMVALARVLLEHVPNVYVQGKEFRADFRSGNRT
jgi:pyruvate formate lyase activating enzyme